MTCLALLSVSCATADSRLVSRLVPRLVVSVIDDDGRGLADTQVVVFRMESNGTLSHFASAQTNASGVVVIPIKPPQRYELRPSRPGYEGTTAQPAQGEIGIVLRMRRLEPLAGAITRDSGPRYGTLTGRVLSAAGVPLPNQHIMAMSTSNSGATFSGTTGADGTYVLSVPPDRYTVKAGSTSMSAPLQVRSSPTYDMPGLAVSPPVIVGSGTTVPVDFSLPTAGRLLNLTVTALDDAGRPAGHTEIEVFGHRDPPTPNFATTDFLGTYPTDGKPVEIGPIQPGPFTIIARSVDRRWPLAGMMSIDLQGAPRHVTVVMQSAARMSGRIEFGGRADPLDRRDRTRVVFQLSGSLLNLNSVASRMAASDGTFELTGLIGEGCLRLYDLPAEWRLDRITHEGTDITNRLITLKPGERRSDVHVRLVRGNTEPGPPPVCTR
jgi:carboxypeptidase family protein